MCAVCDVGAYGVIVHRYVILRALVCSSINTRSLCIILTRNSFPVPTVCFLILHISVNLSILAFKMNFNLKAYYTHGSMISFLLADFQKCAMSFMLFWTLFFGLVYLF